MTAHNCRRCGKKARDPRWIPIAGTTYVVSVCSDCYTYLSESDIAYERFVIIERESKKKEDLSEDVKMVNRQGRPSTWTEEEVVDLITMRENGVTTAEMARRLGRTAGAVSGKLSLLKSQGKIKDDDKASDGAPEERGVLNELEKEMAEIIEEQNAEIEKLGVSVKELEAKNRLLEEYNDASKEKVLELESCNAELRSELLDVKGALEETERQLDEYRRSGNAEADAILARYEQELERAEAEISRLTRSNERANRIALGVVERFALTDCAV